MTREEYEERRGNLRKEIRKAMEKRKIAADGGDHMGDLRGAGRDQRSDGPGRRARPPVPRELRTMRGRSAAGWRIARSTARDTCPRRKAWNTSPGGGSGTRQAR